MDIAIIGGGWYGCYVAEYIIDNYENINITLFDKENEIFRGSSSKNQNRLHQGFHYPRCDITQKKCNKYFNKFINKYNNLTHNIDKNYYIISNTSKVKYKDYIRKYNDFTIIKNNNQFINIEGDIINTEERYIDFNNAIKYFKEKFKKKVKYKLNYNVFSIEEKLESSNVIINNVYIFDKVFNCTYNQISDKINNKSIIYEKCITLLYEKNKNHNDFDCLTIMDGNYSSIFYYKNNLYTLTDVEYTPLIKSDSYNEVYNFNNYKINDIIEKFERKILMYYPKFKNNFIYKYYYIYFKCKNNNSNDSRDINVTATDNIMNIWCGKISLIFELDNYIKNFI